MNAHSGSESKGVAGNADNPEPLENRDDDSAFDKIKAQICECLETSITPAKDFAALGSIGSHPNPYLRLLPSGEQIGLPLSHADKRKIITLSQDDKSFWEAWTV